MGTCILTITVATVFLCALYTLSHQSLSWGLAGNLAFVSFALLQAMNNFYFSVLQAQEKSKSAAFNRLQIPLIRAIISMLAITISKSGITICIALLSTLLIIKKFSRIDFSIKDLFIEKIRPPLKKSFPYALETTLSVIILNIPTLYLASKGEFQALANINIGLSFILASYLLPQAFFVNYLFPKLIKQNNKNPKKLFFNLLILSAASTSLGLAIAAVLISNSNYLITLFFGENYSYTARYLEILAYSIPLRYASIAIGCYIATNDYIIQRALTTLFSLLCFFAFILLSQSEISNLSDVTAYSFTATQLAMALGFYIVATSKYIKIQTNPNKYLFT